MHLRKKPVSGPTNRAAIWGAAVEADPGVSLPLDTGTAVLALLERGGDGDSGHRGDEQGKDFHDEICLISLTYPVRNLMKSECSETKYSNVVSLYTSNEGVGLSGSALGLVQLGRRLGVASFVRATTHRGGCRVGSKTRHDLLGKYRHRSSSGPCDSNGLMHGGIAK